MDRGVITFCLQLEMNDIHHHVGAAVHEHHVPADHHMRTAWRRRRQPMLNFLRTRHHLLAQSRRKSPAHPQLPFQPGRKLVALRQSGRQMIVAIMIVIPAAHLLAIVVAVIVSAPVVIIITIVFPVPIGSCNSRRSQAHQQQRHPQFRAHRFPFPSHPPNRLSGTRRGGQITSAAGRKGNDR